MNRKPQTPGSNDYLSNMLKVPPPIEDKTSAALQGDASAFGTLFQWYNPRLYAHALRICGNTPLAKDAVQETFLSAFLHRASLRNPALFYPWLKRILANHCYRLLSKEKACGATDHCIEKKDIIIQQSIEENFEKTANHQWLYVALSQLSDELRACVMLRYFTNFKSYYDIAIILGIPIGTVRSRLSAAKEKLLSCYKTFNDAADNALNESKQWSKYYYYLWGNLYDNSNVRNEFIHHMHPSMLVRFTSGKMGKGRSLLESAIDDDIRHGSQLCLDDVNSSGDVTIISGVNKNSQEHPAHCPPSTVVVLFRHHDKIEISHIFDSPRKIG
jgi:RNA polymerase sigma factor (sigma-70 family)